MTIKSKKYTIVLFALLSVITTFAMYNPDVSAENQTENNEIVQSENSTAEKNTSAETTAAVTEVSEAVTNAVTTTSTDISNAVTDSVTVTTAATDISNVTTSQVTGTTTPITTEAKPIKTDVTTTDKPETGWIQADDGKTYYYNKEGSKLVGLNEIDGETYFFAKNGALKYGWYTIDGIRMFFDLETGKRQTGWISYMNETFYADTEKGKYTGINEIDGITYLFDDYGILHIGWFEYNGNKYYNDRKTGLYTGERVIDGIPYIFSSKGKYQSGWQTVNGLRQFYDYDTTLPVYGWIKYNGLIFYSTPDTGKYTGDNIIDDIKYRFSEKGYQMLGLQKFTDGTRYYHEDGTIGTGFITENGKVYYFGEDYLMKTGLTTIDGSTYYFAVNGEMQYEWQTIDGKKYYFGSNGKMYVGMKKINGVTYYFDSSGVMQTGFIDIDDKTYYFDSKGEMMTGWQTINSKKYYFDDNGVMAYGWLETELGCYYLDKNGAVTGWQTINENKYYFDDNCIRVSGITAINGKKYYFDPKNGALLCGITLNGITTNSDGVITKVLLDTPYLSQAGYPTGCESASAVMLLRDAGYNITIDTFIDYALDTDWIDFSGNTFYGPDPNKAFIGDPRSEYGYGCYAPVITTALSRLLTGGDKVLNITGTYMSDLLTKYIDNGTPVAVWATINMIEMEYGTQWIIRDTGEWFTWKGNEHCLVLVGYDNDYYYMNDPYNSNGLKAYSRSVVENRYAVMGYQAVVIEKSGN